MTAGAIYGGIGGSLLGARQSGFTPVFLIEPRDFANKRTSRQLGVEIFLGDHVTDFRDKAVDVIVGNPSCAQFSSLGMKRKDRGHLGELDPMSFEVTKFLEEMLVRQPKYWVLENVPQIRHHFDFETEDLLGYNFTFRGKVVLPMISYKVSALDLECNSIWPYQWRHRIIFVGSRIDRPTAYTNFWSSPQKLPRGCKEIIDDLGNEEKKEINHVLPKQTARRTERMASLLPGESYYGTQNNRRLDPDSPSYTITSHCTRHIHYRYPRTLTVRECARLQGFPDDFRFFGAETTCFDQVGKSLPPPVAKWIFERIKDELQKRTT